MLDYIFMKSHDEKTQKDRKLNLFFSPHAQITFAYFICNAFWLVTTFSLQLLDSIIFIQVPKIDTNLQFTGEYIYIDPLGFMFLLAFALLVLIQFVAMVYHR